MKIRRTLMPATVAGLLAGAAFALPPLPSGVPADIDMSSFTTEQKLGAELFFDKGLSNPSGQACAGCHDPRRAFTDIDTNRPTSAGVHVNLFGNRNTPTAAYAQFSPAFHFDPVEGLFIGGQFHDGRAATLEDQAKGPFLNLVEMANTSKSMVIGKLRKRPEAPLFKSVYGASILDAGNEDAAYDKIAQAIANFERTTLFKPFSSKFDAYLAGNAALSASETRGLALFEDEAGCAACHTIEPGDGGAPPLFTDFTYDNIGVPKNPKNKFYKIPYAFNPDGDAFVDKGLGGPTGMASEDGKFKVGMLRNLSLTGPYSHNGYFDTLAGIVHFYNTRDVLPACANPLTPEKQALKMKCWPAPETPDNVNTDELGDLGMNASEEADLVAFLLTLTDGWTP